VVIDLYLCEDINGVMVLRSRELRKQSLRSETGKKRNMPGVDDRFVRGLQVPLRALWGKARGGGGRLRQATARDEKRRERRTEEARKDAREEDKSRGDI